MKKDFTGTIVQESLTDASILDNFIQVKSNLDGDWNIITVKASGNDIKKLADYIKDGHWYAHFWKEGQFLAVFKNKLFVDQDEATQYGLSIGIPKEQLDFLRE